MGVSGRARRRRPVRPLIGPRISDLAHDNHDAGHTVSATAYRSFRNTETDNYRLRRRCYGPSNRFETVEISRGGLCKRYPPSRHCTETTKVNRVLRSLTKTTKRRSQARCPEKKLVPVRYRGTAPAPQAAPPLSFASGARQTQHTRRRRSHLVVTPDYCTGPRTTAVHRAFPLDHGRSGTCSGLIIAAIGTRFGTFWITLLDSLNLCQLSPGC